MKVDILDGALGFGIFLFITAAILNHPSFRLINILLAVLLILWLRDRYYLKKETDIKPKEQEGDKNGTL